MRIWLVWVYQGRKTGYCQRRHRIAKRVQIYSSLVVHLLPFTAVFKVKTPQGTLP